MQAVISLLSALVTLDNWHREESEDLVACISVTASALQMQLERGRADLFTPAYLCHVRSCTACQGLWWALRTFLGQGAQPKSACKVYHQHRASWYIKSSSQADNSHTVLG